MAAAAEPKAAVALSKFALHPEFSDAAATAMKTAGAWPDPAKFDSADDRKVAADALARLRPSWSLPWLAKALVGTQARFIALRHFFASRLILASGGLMAAVEALGKDILLDEKISDLVTKADADAGAKLRADKATLTKRMAPTLEPTIDTPPPNQESLIREATWTDADEALGRALRDMGTLDRAFQRLESVVEDEAAERTRRARNAANFVLQWVEQAAHKRSIKALNVVGERVQFDPALHALEDEAELGDYVRVVKPSIVRGNGPQQVVLLRGEVERE